VREVLSGRGNQACIQFDAPDRPGFLDVEVANRLPYCRLVEEVAALRAEVEQADRAWCPLPVTPDRPAGIAWYPPVIDRPAAVAS
jgi:hypothetical protein